MAQDRTNMVSFLDTGKLMGGNTSKISELGDGFTEISEDWGANVESKQYVNMKSASNTVKGYDLSIEAEREYLSDDMQTVIDNMFKKFPTGTQCETSYYRFYKTDVTDSGTFNAIKVHVVVCPSSTGGAGGDTLVSSIQIKGNGDVVEGTMAIDTKTGEWSFTEA